MWYFFGANCIHLHFLGEGEERNCFSSAEHRAILLFACHIHTTANIKHFVAFAHIEAIIYIYIYIMMKKSPKSFPFLDFCNGIIHWYEQPPSRKMICQKLLHRASMVQELEGAVAACHFLFASFPACRASASKKVD